MKRNALYKPRQKAYAKNVRKRMKAKKPSKEFSNKKNQELSKYMADIVLEMVDVSLLKRLKRRKSKRLRDKIMFVTSNVIGDLAIKENVTDIIHEQLNISKHFSFDVLMLGE